MSEIHTTKKRMPITLHPNNENNWLHGEDYNDFKFLYSQVLQAKKLDIGSRQFSLF